MTKPKRVIVVEICKLNGMDPESAEAMELHDNNNFSQLYSMLQELRSPKTFDELEEDDAMISLNRHFSDYR